jgi:hypothetical protein
MNKAQQLLAKLAFAVMVALAYLHAESPSMAARYVFVSMGIIASIGMILWIISGALRDLRRAPARIADQWALWRRSHVR